MRIQRILRDRDRDMFSRGQAVAVIITSWEVGPPFLTVMKGAPKRILRLLRDQAKKVVFDAYIRHHSAD